MAKSTSSYICQQCEHVSIKWLGRCPNCGNWNSFVETTAVSRINTRKSQSNLKPTPISSVRASSLKRISTKISELDRVLGSGLVPGQVVLIAGEPGVGKSTLLLQLSQKLGNVLYASGEESVNQLAIRAKRLGVQNKTVQVVESTDADEIINSFKGRTFKALIVDSIQTVATKDLSSMAGSVGQVRECTYRLVGLAKKENAPVFIVGHVTKQGTVAGPSVLAHLVDTVLWFEGDKQLTLRLLRAVKNRFGPTDEVGIFEMNTSGIIPVSDSSKLFVEASHKKVPGSCNTVVMEGTRPIVVEVQSLIIPTKLAFAKRTVQGIDSKRVEMILAVLQRRLKLPLNEYDVFVNVVGGIKLKDTAADLAVAISLASSFYDKPILKSSVATGEIGLLGEIRKASDKSRRDREARRLGYKSILTKEKDLQQVVHKLFN